MNNKIKYSISDRKKPSIDRKVLSLLDNENFEDIEEIDNILIDCFFYEYANENIIKLCNKLIEKRDVFKEGRHYKDLNEYERRFNSLCGRARVILEYTPYKFFFMGGATAEHRTLYAKSHIEAWNKANTYCIDSFGGNVRAIICLTKDGEDIGTLKNLEAMFAPMPENPKEVRSVRAVDFIPNYKEWK